MHFSVRHVDHRKDPGHFARVNIERFRLGIERRPAPLFAAVIAGKDHRAFAARGCERNARPQPRETLAAEIPDVVRRQSLARERRRFRRQRLRRPCLLAFEIRRFDGLLFDRKKRVAGLTVEDEDMARFRNLRNSVDAVDSNQVGWCRKIPIPNVVMDELIVPDPLARASVERKERVGKEVLPDTIAAVEIVSGGSGRNVNDTAVQIEAQGTGWGR